MIWQSAWISGGEGERGKSAAVEDLEEAGQGRHGLPCLAGLEVGMNEPPPTHPAAKPCLIPPQPT